MLLTSFSVPPDAGENLSFFGKLGGAAGGILYHWLSEEPSAQVTGTTTTGKGTYFTKRLSIIAHPRVEALLAGPIGPSVLEARRSSDAASAGERCSRQNRRDASAWVMPSELSVSRNSAPFHFSAGSKLPTSSIASPVPAPVVAVPAAATRSSS